MKATFHRYVQAARRRREDGAEQGFSLIELIVVVAILGILVAIAIPVFTGIDHSAKVNSAKASAQNAATSVAAVIANGDTAPADLEAFEEGDITLTYKGVTETSTGAPTSIADVCVVAAYKDITETQSAGPGC